MFNGIWKLCNLNIFTLLTHMDRGGCAMLPEMDIRTSTVVKSQLRVNFCDLAWSKREQRKSFVPSWAFTLPCSAVCLSPWVLYYKWRLAQSRGGWVEDCGESDPTHKQSDLNSRARLIAMFPFAFFTSNKLCWLHWQPRRVTAVLLTDSSSIS